MKLKMKFQSDSGKEFDDAVSAANDDHYERVRDIAVSILLRQGKYAPIPSHVVDELADYLLVMEKIGFSALAEAIEYNRKRTDMDAAEFTRNGEIESDEQEATL